MSKRKLGSSMVSRIPIFITARGNDKDTFKKNKEALKFSYLFIKEQNLFGQTYIISDNKEMLDYAIELGFKYTIHYPCGSQKDVKYLEYLATYRYAVEMDYKPDWIIILNINQLFKDNSLLIDCITNIDDNYNVVASYTEISNRSHFFIDESLLNTNKEKSHLLSSEYQRVKMVDAAIYAIKTTFAFECMEYNDPSEHFWNTNIKYFKNKSLFTDIYELEDINKYYYVGNVINKIKEIK